MDFLIKLDEKISPAANKANQALATLQGSLKSGGETVAKYASAFGAAGKVIAIFVAAATAAVGATLLLTAAFIKLGAASSEEKGDITRSLELLYGSQEAAEHTYKVLEGITGRIAISQERVMELSQTLIKAGQVNGDQMVASIEAIGKAEAARKGAGQVIEGVITRSQKSRVFSINREELMATGLTYRELAKNISKETGRGVAEAEIQLRTGGVKLKAGLDALNKAVDSKMGELAARKFNTVGVQVQRMSDGFRRLFENFNTAPIAKGIKVIADLFDETTVSGAAMRTLLGSIWDNISAAIEAVTPYAEKFFKGLILFGLKVWNALFPLRKAIKDTFGGDNQEGLQTFENTLLALGDDIGRFVGTTAEYMAAFVRNWDALWQTFDEIMADPIGAILSGFADMFIALNDTIEGGWKSIVDWFVEGGKNIVSGIIEGITSGAGAVGQAMQNLAQSGLNKFKDVFGIASPSKVMAQQGLYLNEGLAQGVEKSSDKPAAAMAKAVDGAVASRASGPGASPSAVSGAQVSVTFQPGSIIIQGGAAMLDNLESKLAELMGDVMQQAATLQGAG